MGKIELLIIERKIIAKDTVEISFDLVNQDFKFQAGQYIQISIPKLLYPDPKGASRVFSICSSPNNKKNISIAFRNSGSGFKRTLADLPAGTAAVTEGPFGFFTLPKNLSQSTIVFIAGGIGITPCMSMIRFADEGQLSSKITLLYANRDKESAAYLPELQAIAQKNSDFSLINKLGRIDIDFIGQSIKNLNEPIWYVVGPPAMVADVREMLFQMDIDMGRVYFEEFVGY